MTDNTSLPGTPEGLADWMANLTFHPDQVVPEAELPPVLAEDEDAWVTRSFKVKQRFDETLGRIAEAHGIPKSELIRRYLETAVAAELAAEGDAEVLIPLADALRALTGLGHLPRSA